MEALIPNINAREKWRGFFHGAKTMARFYGAKTLARCDVIQHGRPDVT